MTDESKNEKYDLQFYQLILSLHGGAMQQMGKIASPVSGKVERDLAQAQATIDLIDMLKNKTRGNLSDEEQKLIDHVLYELRLNYVDEVKKEKAEKAAAADSEKKTEPDQTSEASEPQSDAESDDN